MSRSSYAAVVTLAVAATLIGAAGCKPDSSAPDDQDILRRRAWVHAQTAEEKLFVREHLTHSDGNYEFGDGWYWTEYDPKTRGAWKWMERKGIIRLRTRIGAATRPSDMELTLYGWVTQENLGLRTQQIELAVNGHVLERFDPPKNAFEHKLIVPRHLLEHSTWVDFTITVANTVRPNGDWRDLGFATTGFQWKPVEGS
jgi:hypothetical protein